MIVNSVEELNAIREECKSMVTKRAAASGVAAIIPIPGTDIAADIGMLMELLPAISRRFGLSKEQVDQMDDMTKVLIVQVAKTAGSAFVGQVVTKELIMLFLKKIAGRIAVKQVVKYIPFVGQAAAAAISFAAMKYVGESHIDECYEVAKKLIAQKMKIAIEENEIALQNDLIVDEAEMAQATKKDIMESLKLLKELLDANIIDQAEFQQKKTELLSRL